MSQECDKLRGRCAGQVGAGRAVPWTGRRGNDPPDAALILADEQVGAILEFGRHELGVLDDGPRHVDDVEGTVGSVRQEDRAKMVVGRGEELDPGTRGREWKVAPSSSRISAWTRLPVGSHVKTTPR